ncbi:MAG: hypothetical protein JSS66_09730 [Armatimonadetes bacterium]|nr:hypothetical protein [Armatimonadota bacterium]
MNWDTGNKAAMMAAVTVLIITGGAFALNHHLAGGLHGPFSPLAAVHKPVSTPVVETPAASTHVPVTAGTVESQVPVSPAVASESPTAVLVSEAPTPRVSVLGMDLGSQAANLTAKAKVDSSPVAAAPVRSERITQVSAAIDGWLKRLYETETSRRNLAQSQIRSLLTEFASLLAGPSAAMKDEDDFDSNRAHAVLQSIYGRAMELKASWAQLDNYLHSIGVPERCKAIDQSYTDSLRQTQAMLAEIGNVCLSAKEDPTKALGLATSMSGTSGGRIDNPAVRANSQLQELFKELGIQPWFDIDGDIGANLWSH